MEGAFVIGRRPFWPRALAVVCGLLAVGFFLATFAFGPWWLGAVSALFGVLAGVHAYVLGDKAPLFVADEHGVRMPTGGSWIGLLWQELGEITVEGREGLRHDPQVKVVTADGQRMYAAPLGMATNVSVAEAREALARHREPAAY